MPIERLTVSCLEELLAKVGEWKSKADKIYLFFCGDRDKATGESWCPDCVKAEPIVEKVLEKPGVSGVFIKCIVGNRDSWKDPQNVFRQHPDLQLKGVPTLMLWGTQKKLGDEDCSKASLVEMMFEDD
ncbi:thioredoxin domain-containing protein 17-like [Halichondria panicea]|uniref:thioredoxin domain-containing protein 17-like n=1 Tax=Halichondria panicea TaxID=6063 RepID=UPI00312B9EA0